MAPRDVKRLCKWLDRQLTLPAAQAERLLKRAVATGAIRTLPPLLRMRAQAAYAEGPEGWKCRGLHVYYEAV